MFDPKIFVNVRDRVTPLRALVDWLERAGHEHIILIDNASTYEPLLDYLDDTPHDVVRLAHNAGARSIWETGIFPQHEWFVYSDPDVVPIGACPFDAIQHLRRLLDRHQDYAKAGLGLCLGDVPASMPSLNWELSLVGIPSWQFPVPRGHLIEPGVFASLIDTTFALHRPGTEFCYEAIRTGHPYQARHASPAWYGTTPSVEDAYYLERAISGPLGSSWKGPDYEEAEGA